MSSSVSFSSLLRYLFNLGFSFSDSEFDRLHWPSLPKEISSTITDSGFGLQVNSAFVIEFNLLASKHILKSLDISASVNIKGFCLNSSALSFITILFSKFNLFFMLKKSLSDKCFLATVRRAPCVLTLLFSTIFAFNQESITLVHAILFVLLVGNGISSGNLQFSFSKTISILYFSPLIFPISAGPSEIASTYVSVNNVKNSLSFGQLLLRKLSVSCFKEVTSSGGNASGSSKMLSDIVFLLAAYFSCLLLDLI